MHCIYKLTRKDKLNIPENNMSTMDASFNVLVHPL
jgi:hypothetical protein